MPTKKKHRPPCELHNKELKAIYKIKRILRQLPKPITSNKLRTIAILLRDPIKPQVIYKKDYQLPLHERRTA